MTQILKYHLKKENKKIKNIFVGSVGQFYFTTQELIKSAVIKTMTINIASVT